MNFIWSSVLKYRIQISHEFNTERIFVRKYSYKKSKVGFRKSVKNQATVKAIKHFDDFYGGIFKHMWCSIRLGLLSQPKHVALLNNFGEIEETKEILKNEGALDLKILLKPEVFELDDTNQCVKDDGGTLNEHNEDEDAMSEKTEDDVLNPLYPEESKKTFANLFTNYKIEEDNEEDGTKESPASLHEALSQSEIDTSRLIDPSVGLDSSSLHEFVPVSELKGNEDYIPEGDYYRFYKVNPEIDIHMEPQAELPFPEYLHVYSFPRGDVSRFSPPRFSVNHVYAYYPMDGSSILPVLALGLEPGDKVLDLCAAPGGKSLAILQTMLPDLLVCNDSSLSRCNRMKHVFHQFLDNYPQSWQETVIIKTIQGQSYVKDCNFNKVLVDVPCTTDRLSVTEEDNNIFKSSRTRERLTLPEVQANLLENALAIVEPGGTVVYSTCTLSPIQNEGVVNVALQNVWRNHGVEFTVVDLNPAISKMKHFYRFATRIGLRYGSLVVPFMPNNFGPMYFCKFIKNK